MKYKLLIFLILVSVNRIYSQDLSQPFVIDSLMTVIKESRKNDICRLDSGNLKSPESQTSIGTYQRAKYFDKKTGALKNELYLQKFNTGVTHYDTYYYWDNKVIYVDRLVSKKNEEDTLRSFFVWNGHLFEMVGDELVDCGQSVKLIGNRLQIANKK